MGVANYFQDPVFRAGLEKTAGGGPSAPPPATSSASTSNPSLTWDDLAWLRELTSLPILLKGIQHVDDAREAARRGIDGIVVSNHGGRQVDGAIASLDALPPIAAAVGDELTILFDSGVRGGADVLKALALGADAVFLGRPYIWGLALEGQAGVETVLKMVLAELDLTMALCGLTQPGGDQPGLPRRGVALLVDLREERRDPLDRLAAGAGAELGQLAPLFAERGEQLLARCAAGRARAAGSSPAGPRPGCRGLRRGARGRPRPWPAPTAGSPRRSG